MHPANIDWTATRLTTLIIKTMMFEEETSALQPLTNAHRDAWVIAARQVVARFEEAIKEAEETDYDKLHL